jgi:hypothetical protein
VLASVPSFTGCCKVCLCCCQCVVNSCLRRRLYGKAAHWRRRLRRRLHRRRADSGHERSVSCYAQQWRSRLEGAAGWELLSRKRIPYGLQIRHLPGSVRPCSFAREYSHKGQRTGSATFIAITIHVEHAWTQLQQRQQQQDSACCCCWRTDGLSLELVHLIWHLMWDLEESVPWFASEMVDVKILETRMYDSVQCRMEPAGACQHMKYNSDESSVLHKLIWHDR